MYFESGRPCYAVSNLAADRFAPFLVRVGKLTDRPARALPGRRRPDAAQDGEILVEMGILRDTEKLYYIAQQVKAIAYSLFAWEEGRYRIHFTGRALQERVKIEIAPTQLISRGVRKLYRPERLARLLGDDDFLVPTQQPTYPLHDVELEDWEAQLLVRIDGNRPVRELIAMMKRPPEMVRASLWALVALEIVEKRLPVAT